MTRDHGFATFDDRRGRAEFRWGKEVSECIGKAKNAYNAYSV